MFGRRRVVVDGGEFTVEMRQSGITVRPKWGRHPKTLSFSSLIDAVSGQFKLPL